MFLPYLARGGGVVAAAGAGEVPNRLQPAPEAGGGVVIGHNYVQLDYASDSGEDDDWWNDRNYIQSGVKVEVLKCQIRIIMIIYF